MSMPQSCHVFLLRLEGAPETHKFHHPVEQILLGCSGVVELDDRTLDSFDGECESISDGN